MPQYRKIPGRFTVWYRYSGFKKIPSKTKHRWIKEGRTRHPLGIMKHWNVSYPLTPERDLESYSVAKTLCAANARLVEGLPERFLATARLFPVEAVEDDIRHSLWQAANVPGEPLIVTKLAKRQLFTQYLIPNVFQHLWRLPSTDFAKTNHLSYQQLVECFFSRFGKTQTIEGRLGMLMRNSVPVKPYALGDEQIAEVLSGALKPAAHMDFTPAGPLFVTRKKSHRQLVPRGGFLQGTNKLRTTFCERRYAISSFMNKQVMPEGTYAGTLGTAILYMYGQLHSQAYVRERINTTDLYRRVTPASGPHARGVDLPMPEVCHGVITNGQDFTFLVMQMHNVAPEFDGFENIVWASESMKLFEDLEAESAGPVLNLECLRLLAAMLHYDPRLYWPLYAEETQDFLGMMRSANEKIGRRVDVPDAIAV